MVLAPFWTSDGYKEQTGSRHASKGRNERSVEIGMSAAGLVTHQQQQQQRTAQHITARGEAASCQARGNTRRGVHPLHKRCSTRKKTTPASGWVSRVRVQVGKGADRDRGQGRGKQLQSRRPARSPHTAFCGRDRPEKTWRCCGFSCGLRVDRVDRWEWRRRADRNLRCGRATLRTARANSVTIKTRRTH
jgi:hypothetical protein